MANGGLPPMSLFERALSGGVREERGDQLRLNGGKRLPGSPQKEKYIGTVFRGAVPGVSTVGRGELTPRAKARPRPAADENKNTYIYQAMKPLRGSPSQPQTEMSSRNHRKKGGSTSGEGASGKGGRTTFVGWEGGIRGKEPQPDRKEGSLPRNKNSFTGP